MVKVLIGLIIPYLGVLGLMPWTTSVAEPVAGIPFIYFWMFCWFIITSGCLYTCYKWFDSRASETADES